MCLVFAFHDTYLVISRRILLQFQGNTICDLVQLRPTSLEKITSCTTLEQKTFNLRQIILYLRQEQFAIGGK